MPLAKRLDYRVTVVYLMLTKTGEFLFVLTKTGEFLP